MPVKTGIQKLNVKPKIVAYWIPAFACLPDRQAGMTYKGEKA
jgi:hypothetical protein